MSNGRTTITADNDAVDAVAAHKRDEDSWTDVLFRAAEALEAVEGDGEHGLNTLTEDHIDDIAARTAERTADEVENPPYDALNTDCIHRCSPLPAPPATYASAKSSRGASTTRSSRSTKPATTKRGSPLNTPATSATGPDTMTDTDSPDDALSLDDLPQPADETTVPPADLHVDGDNPNEQSDEMFGLLVENMREHGWIGNAIIANTGDLPSYDGDPEGLIADGEHRWRAAQELGLNEVPVKFYNFEDDAGRRLWRQELNKISGEHDAKRDALEYDYLIKEGRSDEVHDLVDAADEDLDDLLDEIRANTNRTPGYDFETSHEVYFEDCVQGMRDRLEDNSVDLVFTSPPYNVGLAESADKKTDGYVPYSDDRDQAEYREFIGEVLDELARVIKPTGHIFVNLQVDVRDGTINPPTWIPERMPLPWRSYIVWNKANTSRSSIYLQENGRFIQSWEPVYHFSNSEEPLDGKRNFAVWDVAPANLESDHDTGVHPAPFSVELVRNALEPTTSPGDTVLDPFMGSGTTAVAAILNDRDYVGFELDEEDAYRPVIKRRIQEAKRQRAATVNTED